MHHLGCQVVEVLLSTYSGALGMHVLTKDRHDDLGIGPTFGESQPEIKQIAPLARDASVAIRELQPAVSQFTFGLVVLNNVPLRTHAPATILK